MSRVNPYTRLLGEIKEFCHKVKYRPTKVMWHYPLNKLGDKWTLSDLYQRAAAANQLGYEVHVRAEEQGLVVIYVAEAPDAPLEWRY